MATGYWSGLNTPTPDLGGFLHQRAASTMGQLTDPSSWKSLGSYPSPASLPKSPQGGLDSLRDPALEMAMDWNPVTAGLAGIIRNVGRGYEKGTWNMAFDRPREMGSHMAEDSALYNEFQKMREWEGKTSKTKELKVDLNSLDTVDTGSIWNPFNTIRSLNVKGMDKLSKSSRKELNDIQTRYLEEKGKLVPSSNVNFGDLVEELDIKYNKQIQDILEKEGYDSISYDAVEVLEGAVEGNPRSYIVFKNPESPHFTTKTTDIPDFDNMLKDPAHFFKDMKVSHQVVYMSPDKFLEENAKNFSLMNRTMRKEYIKDKEPKAYQEALLGKVSHDPSITVTPEDLITSRTNKKMMGYMEDMKNGDVFPMGVLDFSGEFGQFAQEGLHRAVAAKNLGIPYIPVMRIGKASEKRLKRAETPYERRNRLYEETKKEVERWKRQGLLREEDKIIPFGEKPKEDIKWTVTGLEFTKPKK